jgi:hypothetical protein
MNTSLPWWPLLVSLGVLAILGLPAVLPGVLTIVLGPVAVRRGQRVPRTLRVEPTRAEELSPEVRDFVHAAVRQFAAQGFEAAANVSLAGAVTDGLAVELLLVNRATGDVGSVGAVAHWPTGARSFVVAVRSLFPDGTEVMTACGSMAGPFSVDPLAGELMFGWGGSTPHARDARALCEAHRRRLKRVGKADAPRLTPAAGEEIEFLHQQWRRELEQSENSGHQYRDASGDHNRLTWKGALDAAWSQLEWVRAWRQRRREREGRRAWDALGMGEWVPPAGDVNARVAPPQGPSPAPSAASLPAPLAPGDIQFDRQPAGGMTVRVVQPTPFEFMRSRWVDVVTMAVLAAFALYYFVASVQQRQAEELIARTMPPGTFVPGNGGRVSAFAWLAAALLVAEAFHFLRGLLLARRGPVILAADPSGLAYENADAWRGRGRVAREQLDGLCVRPVAGLGIFGKTYRLELRRLGRARPVVLLTGPDDVALETVKLALEFAMGTRPALEDQPPPLPALAAA